MKIFSSHIVNLPEKLVVCLDDAVFILSVEEAESLADELMNAAQDVRFTLDLSRSNDESEREFTLAFKEDKKVQEEE